MTEAEDAMWLRIEHHSRGRAERQVSQILRQSVRADLDTRWRELLKQERP